jgi:RND family efflux transporter MFP subunit
VVQTGPALEPVEMKYITYEVTLGSIEDKVTAPGSFVSQKVTDVYFTGDGGHLAQVHVKLGQAVKEGDLLVELNTSDLEDARNIASYERKKAALRLENIKVSGASAADIQIAEYELKKADSNYRQLAQRVENSKLYAPVDGVVGYIAPYNRGDYINAYAEMIRIVNTDQLRIVVDGKAATNFSASEKVKISYNGQTLNGTVYQGAYDGVSVRSTQEADLQSYITLDDYTPTSTDMGQSVTVTLQRQYKENVIVIPVSLLTEFNERSFVRLLVNGSKQEVDVETGIVTATQAEIVSGLEVGDLIIRN